ncbi:shikimate kinase [Thalassospiraceae bacterium LMO-JJ14]|nr:shikimate kinase [Thalassospiraceae bacterium LMO-JJ14]
MAIEPTSEAANDDDLPEINRPLVLVGLMGAGKSCIGRRMAESFRLPFRDSDSEVEEAAGCEVRDIFEVYGEPAFRDCERRVIQRLLHGEPCIIATGGGAFMDPETREEIKANATSIWLRADPEVLHQRTKRSKNRPLLSNADPLATLKELADKRYPIYAEADITIDTANEGLEITLEKIITALRDGSEAEHTP